MQLYTKCNKCGELLTVEDAKTNKVRYGVKLNDNVFCHDCAKKEQDSIVRSICKKYNLNFEECGTYTKDENLYLQYSLGGIDKEYYGFNDYSFAVNTFTLIPYIKFDDKLFELKGLDNKIILKMMELVRFMCD